VVMQQIANLWPVSAPEFESQFLRTEALTPTRVGVFVL
jgi:hypothetical protein